MKLGLIKIDKTGYYAIADHDERQIIHVTKELQHALTIIKSVNAYPELIQTLKDLQEVLIEAKLPIHAKGIEELLKKYN